MTDDADLPIAQMEAILDLMRRQASGSMFYLELKTAAFIAGVSEAQMRKRCEEDREAHREGPGGYAFKSGGRWTVGTVRFLMTLPLSALVRFRQVDPVRSKSEVLLD
jgi:hypothetical protein